MNTRKHRIDYAQKEKDLDHQLREAEKLAKTIRRQVLLQGTFRVHHISDEKIDEGAKYMTHWNDYPGYSTWEPKSLVPPVSVELYEKSKDECCSEDLRFHFLAELGFNIQRSLARKFAQNIIVPCDRRIFK